MASSLTSKVLALSLGQGLTTIVAIVNAMIMSRLLTYGQLATYRQSVLAFDLVAGVLALGVPQAVYYFLPAEEYRRRGVVVDGLIIMALLGFAGAGFFALGGNVLFATTLSNPILAHTLLYFAILPIFSLPALLLPSVLVTQDKVTRLAIFSVSTNITLLTAIGLACYVWRDPVPIIATKVAMEASIGTIAIWLICTAVPHDDWRPTLGTLRRLLSFSVPLGLASILGLLQINIDRVLVSSLCGPEAFAIYSNGAIEVPVIGIVTGSIATAILPDLRRFVAAGDFHAAVALFRRAATKSAAILIPTMLFLMVVADSVMVLLFSDKYIQSATPFRIYLLLLPVRIVVYGSMMIALGLNHLVLYRTAASLVFKLCVGYALVSIYGYVGAAVSTVATTYFVGAAWSLHAIGVATKCPILTLFPLREVFQLTAISACAALPVIAWQSVNGIGEPFTGILVAASLYGAVLVVLAIALKNQPLLIMLHMASFRGFGPRLRDDR